MKTLPLLVAAISLTFSIADASAQTLLSHTKALAGGVNYVDGAGYPVTLAVAGSYRLTSNLIVPQGTVGVHIVGSNVTLDLNGFTVYSSGDCNQGNLMVVTCTQPSQASAIGIYVQGNDVVVRNGRVRGFSGDGLSVNRNITLEQLQISDNAGDGVGTTTSQYSTVRMSNLHVHTNGGSGIKLDTAGLIENARIEHNGYRGIDGASGKVLVVNTIASNNRLTGLQDVVARSTISVDNGTNRSNVTSLGSNLDDGVPY